MAFKPLSKLMQQACKQGSTASSVERCRTSVTGAPPTRAVRARLAVEL